MTLRRVVALLLIVAAGLLLIGVANKHTETTRTKPSSATTTSGPSAGEGSEGHSESGETHLGDTAAAPRIAIGSIADADIDSHRESNESVLGVNLESNATAIIGLIVSVLLAAGLVPTRSASLALVVIIFSLGFAVIDVVEAIHQRHLSARLGLLASFVAVVHLTARTSLAVTLRRSRGTSRLQFDG